MDTIEDGTGKGYKAKVDSDHRLYTYSKSASIQHINSEIYQSVYQVIGVSTLTTGTIVILHLTNNDPNNNVVCTYLRHQILEASGGTNFPNSNNYFSVRLTRTYTSGGSETTPVNIFSGSGNTAKVTCYQNNPTLSGTALEIDRYYTKENGDMYKFNKEGSLIIPPNQTIEISYVSDHTTGIIYTRLSFIMGS